MSDNENDFREADEDVEWEVPAWDQVESPKLVIDKLKKWKKGIQDKKKQKIANTQKFQEMMKQQIEDEKRYEIQIKLKRQQQRRSKQVTIKPIIPKRKLLIITPTKEGFDSFEKDVHYMEAENEYKKDILIDIIKKQKLDLERKEDRIEFIRYIFDCVKDINKLLPTSEEDPVEENWIHKWKQTKGKKIISKPIGRVYFRTIQDMYKRVSDILNRYIRMTKRMELGELQNYLLDDSLILDLNFIFKTEHDRNQVYTFIVDFMGNLTEDGYNELLFHINVLVYNLIFGEFSDFYSVITGEKITFEIIEKIIEHFIYEIRENDYTSKIIEYEFNQLVKKGLLVNIQTSKPYYLTPEYTGLGILTNGKIKNDIPNDGLFSFNNSIEYWTPINYYFDGEPVNLDNIPVGDNKKVYLKPSYYYEDKVKKEYERYFYDFYDYLKAWEMTYQEQGNIQKVNDIQNYFIQKIKKSKNPNEIIKLRNYIHYDDDHFNLQIEHFLLNKDNKLLLSKAILENKTKVNIKNNIININKFEKQGSGGQVFNIILNGHEFIAKSIDYDHDNKTCIQEFIDERTFLERAKEIKLKTDIPNLPYIFNSINSENLCILYIKKEINTIPDIFNKPEFKDINKFEFLKQCFVSIYILHRVLKIFHCDTSFENFLYQTDKRIECLKYIIRDKEFTIYNQNLIVIPFDFGESIKYGDTFGECDSFVRDYKFFIHCFKEKCKDIELNKRMNKITELIQKYNEDEFTLFSNIMDTLNVKNKNKKCYNLTKTINVNEQVTNVVDILEKHLQTEL